MKLIGEDNTFTGERGNDGANCEPIGAYPNVPTTVTVTISNLAYFNVEVYSHVANILAAATFYDLETTVNMNCYWNKGWGNKDVFSCKFLIKRSRRRSLIAAQDKYGKIMISCLENCFCLRV